MRRFQCGSGLNPLWSGSSSQGKLEDLVGILGDKSISFALRGGVRAVAGSRFSEDLDQVYGGNWSVPPVGHPLPNPSLRQLDPQSDRGYIQPTVPATSHGVYPSVSPSIGQNNLVEESPWVHTLTGCKRWRVFKSSGRTRWNSSKCRCISLTHCVTSPSVQRQGYAAPVPGV